MNEIKVYLSMFLTVSCLIKFGNEQTQRLELLSMQDVSYDFPSDLMFSVPFLKSTRGNRFGKAFFCLPLFFIRDREIDNFQIKPVKYYSTLYWTSFLPARNKASDH